MNRVVVSGLGIVSPLGEGSAENWENLIHPSICPEQKTSCGSSFALGKRSDIRGFSRAKEFVWKAALEALGHAGLWEGAALQHVDSERVGCTVSASKPLFNHDTPIPPEAINDFVCEQFHLEGERRNVIAACATGAYSIALGASWIETGLCDVVLAGSVEPYPHPLIEAGFRQMGVTSPDGLTRPFDRDRSGFAFGEGAGVVVLESAAHLKARGGRALAQLSGWALGADSHSAVAFNSNGAKIAAVIEKALHRSGLSKESITHVNAHGTATRINDWIETQALLKAFGSHARDLMISATKASTGHLLGASGSVEFILTVLALERQFIPPTATLEEPDPQCALDYTPKKGHVASFQNALSLSFGFGGPIGALVVSAC